MKTCRADGCDRRVRVGGLCYGHGRNGASAQVAQRRSGSLRDDAGRKHCRTCDEWLPVETFTKDHRSKDGLRSICLKCHSAKRRARQFGVTEDWFDQTFESQGRACAICASADPRGKGWAIDHDHRCCPIGASSCGSCIRGILCGPCNLALGMVRDDTHVLASAIACLEAHTFSPRLQ